MIRTSRRVRLIALAAIAALGAACSGGGGGSSLPGTTVTAPGGGGAQPASSGQVVVTANFPKTGPLPMSRASRAAMSTRRHTLSGGTFASFEFTGTLYPGYAGAAPIVQHSIVNATSLPSSASLSFNNVPTGNNSWVLIDAVGYDTQNAAGSSVDLGDLGGLVNASSTPASITVDSGSTLRLQLALTAMQLGILSSYDLSNETSLDSDLGNFIGQSGASTSASTGLYSDQTLATLSSNLVSRYLRTLTITGSIATASTAWVTWDYTNTAELNYATNIDKTFYVLQPIDQATLSFPHIYGNPNGGLEASASLSPHIPSVGPSALPQSLLAESADAPTGSATFTRVYGGALRVGVSSQPSSTTSGPPFYGGFASVAGRAVNTSSTVNVSVGNSTVNFSNADATIYGGNSTADGLIAFASPYRFTISNTGPLLDAECNAGPCFGQSNVPILTAATNSSGSFSIDNFNPFGLPSNYFQFCDIGSGECLPLVSNGTLTTHTPFYDDPLTDTYTLAAAGGATTTISHSNGGYYTVNYSGGTSGYVKYSGGSGTYYFNAGQQLDIVTTAPEGTTFYLNACGYNQAAVDGDFVLQSVPGLISCTTGPTIGYSFPAGTASSGSFSISAITPSLSI